MISRIKVWVFEEAVKFDELNGEFDNIINGLDDTDNIGDYSATVPQMQLTTDPGEAGSESLPTNLSGELERIRFTIKEIKDTSKEWYESPSSSLAELGTLAELGNNRIISGLTRTSSSQPLFLVPDGATNEVTLNTTPNLVLVINGTTVTFSSDQTLSVSTAPSTNNTATVGTLPTLTSENTKYVGEAYYDALSSGTSSLLPISTAGSEITGLTGKLAAFKVNNGVDDEYFIARVVSSIALDNVQRGFFFNSAGDPVPRITISAGDTITLLRLSWIFARNDGTTLVQSVTNPYVGSETPTGAVAGDYWFDTGNDTWKRHDGGSFVVDDSILIGVTAQDSTACIAARALDFSYNFAETGHDTKIKKSSASTLTWTRNRNRVSVYGSTFEYPAPITWDIVSDLETGFTEAASTIYYAYITETGAPKLSPIAPYDRRGDLRGYYHPHQSWRCLGAIYNSVASDFDLIASFDFIDQVSFSSGTVSVGAGDTTVLSHSVIGRGKKFIIMLKPDGSTSPAEWHGTAGSGITINIRLERNGTAIGYTRIEIVTTAAFLPPMLTFIDDGPDIGLNTYTLIADEDASTVNFNYMKMHIYEIG